MANVSEHSENYATVTSILEGAGGICGLTRESITEYCINYGYIDCQNRRVGGINGYCYGAANEINYCINYGTVYGATRDIGGISGYNSQKVSYCINYGEVNGGYYVGGIIGALDYGCCFNNINHGYVTYIGELDSNAKGFGGIVGWQTNGAINQSNTNYGTITAYSYIGGIAGYLGAGSTIIDCEQFGLVFGCAYSDKIVGCDNN